MRYNEGMEDIKRNISANLVLLRKSCKLTQQELAAKFNYSDKAVSRWEVGDSLPDISVLLRLCEFYGVDFDYLIHAHEEAPGPIRKNQAGGIKVAIILLLVALIFTVATIVFVYGSIFKDGFIWLAFVWAAPISLAVAAYCSRRWWHPLCTLILSSLLVWTLITAIYLHLIFSFLNVWPIYFLGIPAQIILILLYYIRNHSVKP